MIKSLLLISLSMPFTHAAVSMDDLDYAGYNHPYSPLIEEENKNDLLYPGYSEMSKDFEKLSDQDLFKLATKYYAAPTRENNKEKVRLLLKKAEENGHPQAAHSLGYMWEKGEGGNVNIDEAIKLYSKAARLGVEAAAISLADLYQRAGKLDLAYKVFAPLAMQGNQLAQIKVAYIIFLDNKAGQLKLAPNDINQAINWCKAEAKQGSVLAQLTLGGIYLEGLSRGVRIEPNIDESLKWYAQAANKGELFAQYKLGAIYYKVNHPERAVVFLKKIVENPQSEKVLGKNILASAAHLLADIYDDGYFKGLYLKNEVEEAYKKAIILGHKNARHNLNSFYLRVDEKAGRLKGLTAVFKNRASKISSE